MPTAAVPSNTQYMCFILFTGSSFRFVNALVHSTELLEPFRFSKDVPSFIFDATTSQLDMPRKNKIEG